MQTDVETLRRAYDALSQGNVDDVLQALDPEVECQLPEGGITTGTIRGHQAVREFLEGYIEAFESFRLEPEQFIDADDRVVVFLRVIGRGRGSGLEVDTRPAHVWTMQRGKGVRVQVFPDRTKGAALEAAGLRG
jgi:ketosteroid isomerase-like protein